MFDVVVRGGYVIDGSGNPRYMADIGVCGNQIAAIGTLESKSAAKVIDAQAHVVCPGFIDMHSHSDLLVLAEPRHDPKIRQGVTTELLGLDGLSYAPLSQTNLQQVRRYLAGLNGNPDISGDWSSVDSFLSRFDRQVAVNVAFLVPHIALRVEAMGWADRAASPREMDRMKQLMAEGMQQGVMGFSTGLDYFPACCCRTEELIEICKIVAQHGGISVWHMRVRDLGLIEAIKEVLHVGEQADVPVHISHFKTSGRPGHGRSTEMLALINEARSKGIDVTFDAYPYTASSSMTVSLLPRWVHVGGPDAILGRLGDAKLRRKIFLELNPQPGSWDDIYIASVSTQNNKVYQGKNFSEAAGMAGKDTPEFVCDLLMEECLAVSHVRFVGNEEDIRTIMKHACHMACSDGLLIGDKPHPRGWGAFSRYLGVYSRDVGVLPLEETIRHMTSLPARRLGLSDRGLLKKGFMADLVVFNPRTVIDKATYDDPRQHPVGIKYVLVNGQTVLAEGEHTELLAGRALRRHS